MADNPGKVLIVEDDSVQQILLERLVINMGYDVVDKVATGPDAVKKALGPDPIDVILMDIRLKSDLDGIDAMHKIRKHSKVKVIYITGNTDALNIKRAKETDFIDFISKPVEQKRLQKAFKKAFQVNGR